MKRTILIILVLLCINAFAIPAMAATQERNSNNEDSSSGGGGGGVDYSKMVDIGGSVDRMSSSSLQKPTTDTMDLVIYFIVIAIFLSFAKGLIKYLWGSSEQKSDGGMEIGKTLFGVAVFVICLLLAGGILGWL